MYQSSRILALIPARGGSKRLPRKNLLDFDGLPLIAHTIAAAHQSKIMDRIVVSTDDAEIAETARQFGAEVPFMRPAELATDTAGFDATILHALRTLDAQSNYDVLVVLQPTSVLRTADDILTAVQLLHHQSADGVVTVTECEHHPLWSGPLPANGCMQHFIKPEAMRRSQDLEKHYRLNGAVYCFRIAHIMKNQGVKYDSGVYASIMSKYNSIDIDDQFDFDVAVAIRQKTQKDAV